MGNCTNHKIRILVTALDMRQAIMESGFVMCSGITDSELLHMMTTRLLKRDLSHDISSEEMADLCLGDLHCRKGLGTALSGPRFPQQQTHHSPRFRY